MDETKVELIIQSENGKNVAKVEISAGSDFGLREYTFTSEETIKKIKRSLLEIAIENEMKNLGEIADGGEKDGKD